MAKTPIFVVLFLMAAALLPGVGVEAQSPPHVFVGEVLLDGAPAPDGTTVRAVLQGRLLARAHTTVRDGKFSLVVEEPSPAQGQEAVIGFAVGDFPAQQTRPWELGELTLLTLTASSILPPAPVDIYPPLPQRLERGREFQVGIRANTGWHQVQGWTITVDFDPSVFTPVLDPNPEAAQGTAGEPVYQLEGPGRLHLNQPLGSPTDPFDRDGLLQQIPLRVLESADTGTTSMTVSVGLTGAQGLAFPLDPEMLTVEVDVVALAADLTGDDVVDIADLAALASAWGKSRGEAGYLESYDLDGDGVIWIGDLAILLESYQPSGVY